jgi:hypothetical protein
MVKHQSASSKKCPGPAVDGYAFTTGIPIQQITLTLTKLMFEVKELCESTVPDDLRPQIADFRRWSEQLRSRAIAAPRTLSRDDLSPWMDASGITHHLAGLDWKELRRRMETSHLSSDEAEILPIMSAVETMFDNIQSMLPERTMLISRWMASYKPDSLHFKPFHVVGAATLRKYKAVWKRIVLYIYRSAGMSNERKEAAPSMSRVESEAIRLMKKLSGTPREKELENAVRTLSASLVMQDLSSGRDFDSPLVLSLAVMAINPQRGCETLPCQTCSSWRPAGTLPCQTCSD